MIRRPLVAVAVVAVLQLLLVGLAVAPRLSAYALGDEYRLRVEPVDPIDVLRGAYVDLSYPGLRVSDGRFPDGERVFVPLVAGARGLADTGIPTTERPDAPPYLACTSEGWRLDCGIDSFFADQAEAQRLERQLVNGAVVTLRVDGRGNAAVVDLAGE